MRVAQLSLLKNLLGNPEVSDDVLQFYLDSASDVICDIRDSDVVETKYQNVQIEIAIELFNKRGAEGQVAHGENNISRTYEKANISPSLLDKITPIAKTPYSVTRVV